MDRRELLRLERLTRGMDRAMRNKLIEDAELEELRDPDGALRRRDFLRPRAGGAGRRAHCASGASGAARRRTSSHTSCARP